MIGNSPKVVGLLIKKDQRLMVTNLNPQIEEEEGLQGVKEGIESLIRGRYIVIIVRNGDILLMNVGMAKVNRRKKVMMMKHM